MTEEQLNAIEERWAESTPGIWTAQDYTDGEPHGLGVACDELEVFVAAPGTFAVEADAVFIASAHQDLPACVREIRRLQEATRTITRLLREARQEIHLAHSKDGAVYDPTILTRIDVTLEEQPNDHR